jgi:hypothetical protein
MERAAQAPETEPGAGAAEQRGIERALSVAAGKGDERRQRQKREADPLRRLERAIEGGLQRYFPFMPKYISIRPRRITNATAVAIGP